MKTTFILGTIVGSSVFIGPIGCIVSFLVLCGIFFMRQVVKEILLKGGLTQLVFTIVVLVTIALLLVQLVSELTGNGPIIL